MVYTWEQGWLRGAGGVGLVHHPTGRVGYSHTEGHPYARKLAADAWCSGGVRSGGCRFTVPHRTAPFQPYLDEVIAERVLLRSVDLHDPGTKTSIKQAQIGRDGSFSVVHKQMCRLVLHPYNQTT